MLDSWARLKDSPDAEQERALVNRRIDVLEAEIQQVQQTMRAVSEAQDFQRQLGEPTLRG